MFTLIPYTVLKNPNVRVKIRWAATLLERRIKCLLWPRVPENALFFLCTILVFLLFIYSPQLHSSIFLLLMLPKKHCYSQMKGFFFTLWLSRNELVNIVSYFFNNRCSVISCLLRGNESAFYGNKRQSCLAKVFLAHLKKVLCASECIDFI